MNDLARLADDGWHVVEDPGSGLLIVDGPIPAGGGRLRGWLYVQFRRADDGRWALMPRPRLELLDPGVGGKVSLLNLSDEPFRGGPLDFVGGRLEAPYPVALPLSRPMTKGVFDTLGEWLMGFCTFLCRRQGQDPRVAAVADVLRSDLDRFVQEADGADLGRQADRLHHLVARGAVLVRQAPCPLDQKLRAFLEASRLILQFRPDDPSIGPGSPGYIEALKLGIKTLIAQAKRDGGSGPDTYYRSLFAVAAADVFNHNVVLQVPELGPPGDGWFANGGRQGGLGQGGPDGPNGGGSGPPYDRNWIDWTALDERGLDFVRAINHRSSRDTKAVAFYRHLRASAKGGASFVLLPSTWPEPLVWTDRARSVVDFSRHSAELLANFPPDATHLHLINAARRLLAEDRSRTFDPRLPEWATWQVRVPGTGVPAAPVLPVAVPVRMGVWPCSLATENGAEPCLAWNLLDGDIGQALLHHYYRNEGFFEAVSSTLRLQ